MRHDVTFTWHPGGDRNETPRTFTTDAESADYLRDLWAQVERLAPGPKRSLLLRELVGMMNLFALFQGAFVAEPESASEPLAPSYLDAPPPDEREPLRAAENEPQGVLV